MKGKTTKPYLIEHHNLPIVVFFLASPPMTLKEMSAALGHPTFKIKQAIDAYLSDKCVIVESKMNL